MNLSENDYIVGVYFAEKKDFGNVIITIKKSKEEGMFDGEMRYRYYSDGNIFNSDDRKTFYQIKPFNSTEEEVWEKFSEALLSIEKLYSDRFEYIQVKGNFQKMIEKSQDVDWLHFKKEPKE